MSDMTGCGQCVACRRGFAAILCESPLYGWTVRRVDPKDFGDKGRPFWVAVDPRGSAQDAFKTKRGAVAYASEQQEVSR